MDRNIGSSIVEGIIAIAQEFDLEPEKVQSAFANAFQKKMSEITGKKMGPTWDEYKNKKEFEQMFKTEENPTEKKEILGVKIPNEDIVKHPKETMMALGMTLAFKAIVDKYNLPFDESTKIFTGKLKDVLEGLSK